MCVFVCGIPGVADEDMQLWLEHGLQDTSSRLGMRAALSESTWRSLTQAAEGRLSEVQVSATAHVQPTETQQVLAMRSRPDEADSWLGSVSSTVPE